MNEISAAVPCATQDAVWSGLQPPGRLRTNQTGDIRCAAVDNDAVLPIAERVRVKMAIAALDALNDEDRSYTANRLVEHGFVPPVAASVEAPEGAAPAVEEQSEPARGVRE